jgi:citrate lyase subunit beta/citryl-CoA lyase
MLVEGNAYLGAAASARTWLFVPGDRPERFEKAVAAKPDLVVLDLEDAVLPENKVAARTSSVEWAREAPSPVAVRINATGTPWHQDDLAAVASLTSRFEPVVIMAPKAESPEELARISDRLGSRTQLVALIETARGVHRAVAVAGTPGVVRVALGTYDLAAELGVDPDHRPAMAAARSAVVLASAIAGLEGPVDGVTGSVNDLGQLNDDVQAASALGFAGKLCIHPRQVAAAAQALAPTAAELAWAAEVLAAVEDAAAAGSAGAVLVAGRMVDAPVVDRAQRITHRQAGGVS